MALRDELHNLIDLIYDGHDQGDPPGRAEAKDAVDGIINADAQAAPSAGSAGAQPVGGTEPPSEEDQANVNPNVAGGDVVRGPVGPGADASAEAPEELDEASKAAQGQPEPGAAP